MQAVCFSGHRPCSLPGYGDPNNPKAKKLICGLHGQIEDAVTRGKFIFLNGAMAGFDILAAEQVIALKKAYPQIRIITIAPYSVYFYSHENCWTPEWICRANEVFQQHDFGISLAEHYRSGIYYERNRVIVDHSSELICYRDGGKGGTKHTLNLAISQSMSVYNLYNDT